MLYDLSKAFWPIFAPSRFLELATIETCFWAIAGSRWACISAAAMVALLIFVATAPVGYWLLVPLEARFPAWQTTSLTPPYGIIALGGDAGHRVEELARLSREFPQARLVYSGRGDRYAAVEELRAAGIDPARVILETSSRSTSENAADTAQIVRPKAVELWLLITSSSHIPRAMGCFRRAGFRVAAYPVDFATGDKSSPPPTFIQRLWQLDEAAKEWIGLLIYRIVGNTDALFPTP